MKKIKLLCALATVMFLMTGCMKYNTTMEVRSDKSMDFKIVYAMDLSSLGGAADDSSSSSVLNESQKADFEKKGYKVLDYKQDNYKGVELIYSVDNIDKVSKEGDFSLGLNDMINENSEKNTFFQIKKGFLKNTYIANYDFKASNSSTSSSTSDPETEAAMKEMVKNMDLKFIVKLPNAAISNNATTVEGNTYTWDLTKESTTNLKFEFEMYNITNICFLAGGVLFAIILIVVIILAATKKKKA